MSYHFRVAIPTELEHRRRGDRLRHVAVVGADAGKRERAHHASSAGVNSITQFVSQLAPPSAENDCSQRGVDVVTPDQ